jgi:hypothetical protein
MGAVIDIEDAEAMGPAMAGDRSAGPGRHDVLEASLF